MPSPFPGMDPYLEDPDRWRGFHAFMIATMGELLNRQLHPRYYSEIEERVYLTLEDDPAQKQLRIPDLRVERRNGRATTSHPKRNGSASAVAVAEPLVITTIREEQTRERRIEIVATETREVVAVLEMLSPSNKLVGSEGRKSFLAKRREVTGSPAHWIEIDLLRDGVSLELRDRLAPHDYFVHVSPVEMRPKGRVWPLQLAERLPSIGIPLRAPDADAPLDLQHALDLVYERGSYDLKLNYTEDPTPPLRPDLAKWANKLLKQKKLRKA